MQKSILIMACIFAFSAFAGEDGIVSINHPEKYCAKIKDGKLIVMHQGNAMISDVTLANGTQIKTDGTIITKDGNTLMLKEGECADKDGKVMMEKKTEKSKG